MPQAEVQLATACLVVIDRQEQSRLARLHIVSDVGKTVTYILIVEDAHDVARVGVNLVVEVHLSADVHRVSQQVAVNLLRPFRLLAFYGQVEV